MNDIDNMIKEIADLSKMNSLEAMTIKKSSFRASLFDFFDVSSCKWISISTTSKYYAI
jgi:hypothetical protein